jgi:DNA repair protein RecO (recombination protein O)
LFEKLEGIVIRVKDYGESDKLVWIYTREKGKISCIAKGAKRPNSRLAACTQLFTYGIFVIQPSSGLSTIRQGDVINNLSSIKKDIVLTAYSAYVCELLDKVTEEKISNPYLFQLVMQVIVYIDEGIDAEILKQIYDVKMLEVLGIKPRLLSCSLCDRTENLVGFSLKNGGMLCNTCAHQDSNIIFLRGQLVKLLMIYSVLDITNLGKINVSDQSKQILSRIIKNYYDEYSGLHLKSKKFLEQLDLFV